MSMRTILRQSLTLVLLTLVCKTPATYSQHSPASDTTNSNLASSPEPFRVTKPDSNVIQSQLVEVKWDVAKTNVEPINCKNVNIRLSTDGGQSFNVVLASNTPNDGKQLVALPPTAQSNLRIRVESVDNVFFAVNPNRFSINTADKSIFLVRHAEKQTGQDPDLTASGQARALKLSDLMARVGATHVFSTDTNRTRQTAQPTVARTGGKVQIYDSFDGLAASINSIPAGSRVLVVGHSNTVGPVASALGATQRIQIGNEYDNLFVINRRSSGTVLERFKYQPDTALPAKPGPGVDSGSGSSIQPDEGTGTYVDSPVPESSGTAELWEEPQDTEAAINDPDRYAWKLFVALNWPADVAARKADKDRMFGENADTVWESWKLSSGANDEVFLKDGVDPGPWIKADPEGLQDEIKAIERKTRDFETEPLQQIMGMEQDFHAQFDDDRSPAGLNENHMNQSAYDFLRDHELYHIGGQEQLFAEAKQKFDQARANRRMIAPHEYKLHFPVEAKEVKAQWRRISIEDKPRYRWAEFTNPDGSKQIFGLTALHITTKDIPNWFWATFEHVDNPAREGAEAWQTATVDSAAGPNGYPTGMGIEGTRWENYRLRGTQVDFFDSFGEPTILANSQIESGFQTTSSCITCHARAAIGPRIGEESGANRLSIFKHLLPQPGDAFIRIGNVGALPEEMFVRRTFSNSITGDLEYLQLDFVWSLMRAQRKPESDGTSPGEVSFAEHIRPLFRPSDVNAMISRFDLSKYEDVSRLADDILREVESGRMPCDGRWPEEKVQLFKSWIDGGKKR